VIPDTQSSDERVLKALFLLADLSDSEKKRVIKELRESLNESGREQPGGVDSIRTTEH